MTGRASPRARRYNDADTNATMLLEDKRHAATFTDEEKLAATEQLERLLVNPHFSHSRRFPSFLRFIVGETLSGRTDMLKERTLGVEVFGKHPDYDTANDPIVRVTAAEIRKRIAQYYQDPAHEHELRVSLPPGSYVPKFDPPHIRPEESRSILPDGAAEVASASDRMESADLQEHATTRRAWVAPALSAVVLLLIGLGGWIWWQGSRPSAVTEFWAPVTNSPDPVLFCIADQTEYTAIALRDAQDPTKQQVLHDNLTAVVIDDLYAVVKVATYMEQKQKRFTLRGEGSTTLMDLRNGPTVFIGAYDNEWTLRLLKPLRFHFVNDPSMTHFGIVDSTSKTPTTWVVDRTQQIATNNYRDYAIVARFTDSTTGKLAVVVAGVGRGGTIAAGELLTDPVLLAPVLRASGDKRNIELVLSTPIIGGEPGPPRVEASYAW